MTEKLCDGWRIEPADYQLKPTETGFRYGGVTYVNEEPERAKSEPAAGPPKEGAP